MNTLSRLRSVSNERPAALRIAAIYAAVGGLWILLSDHALSWLIPEASQSAWFQTAKGWVFVLATAVVLYTLVRRYLERVRQNEETFRSLVENSLTGISIIQEGSLVYQNPEQARIIGPLPRPLIWTEHERIHPDDVEKVRSFAAEMSAGKSQVLETDFRFYPKDGKRNNTAPQSVICRANRIVYDGRAAVLANIIDNTRVRELERALRIQDKMSSLGHVAAGMAHEIRNPLSGINIYLSTLKRLFDQAENLDKVNSILEQIFAASRKIESVIKRVMDFSKPTEPKVVLTDMNRPVSEAIELVAVTVRKSGIDLVQDLHHDLPRCLIDLQMIEEVVLNLINNAAEALRTSDGKKRIVIKSFVAGREVRVTVSDSGSGIAEEIRDRIFDPFCTTKADGTGIGLSICHRIITDHKGTLTVGESEWGGARFELAIPIAKENT